MRQAIARLGEQHPILIYSFARFALFIGVLIPLQLIGLRGLLLLGLALLISGGLSLFLLNDLRSQFSGRMTGYFSRLNERIDDATRAEDAEGETAQELPVDGAAEPSANQGQAQP